jgi:hypothetical protein
MIGTTPNESFSEESNADGVASRCYSTLGGLEPGGEGRA